ARVPDEKRQSFGHTNDDYRARLGHSLRQRQQRRRCPYQFAKEQDRQRLRVSFDPYHSRRWVHARRSGYVKPLGIRSKLTVLYAAVFIALLSGFFIATYYLLANQLESALNNELVERAAGLKGYLHFEDDAPVLSYDSNDSEVAFFVKTATRYY